MADAAAKVIQPNLDKIDSAQQLMTLKDDRERYPFDSWVPLLDPSSLQRLLTRGWRIQAKDADAVAAKMTADTSKITPAVLKFVSQWCSDEVKRSIFDAEITATETTRRRQGLLELGHAGEPASLKALETAVALELAEEPLSLSHVRMSGDYLLKRRPSEKLFPVARTLLRSEARYDILAGIRMADSLGSRGSRPGLEAPPALDGQPDPCRGTQGGCGHPRDFGSCGRSGSRRQVGEAASCAGVGRLRAMASTPRSHASFAAAVCVVLLLGGLLAGCGGRSRPARRRCPSRRVATRTPGPASGTSVGRSVSRVMPTCMRATCTRVTVARSRRWMPAGSRAGGASVTRPPACSTACATRATVCPWPRSSASAMDRRSCWPSTT